MKLTGKGGLDYHLSAKPVKSGGEGEIHDVIGRPGIVAKIYKPGRATPEKEHKLIKMVAFPPDAAVLEQIAWPQDVLYDNGLFAGFIMPKMNINEELNVIYEYGASAKYPQMTWSNKITIAQNLCAVLFSIHESGHVCGDLNPKNISVNPGTGHIIFLDTDSYHIRDGKHTYRCDVGIPEYLPPEVQQKMRGGINLATASLPTFTEYTDCFALAVHIFQLLMNGVHPFACAIIPSQSSVVAPQPADGILRGDCPFLQSIPGVRIPAYAPHIDILPDDIAILFENAFITGHSNPAARPAPLEWHGALKNLRGSLRLCGVVPHHQYFSQLPYCPWCEVDKKYKKLTAPQKAITQTGYEPVAIAPPVGAGVPAGAAQAVGASTYSTASPHGGAGAPRQVTISAHAGTPVGTMPAVGAGKPTGNAPVAYYTSAKPVQTPPAAATAPTTQPSMQSTMTGISSTASHVDVPVSFVERLEEQIKSGVFAFGVLLKFALMFFGSLFLIKWIGDALVFVVSFILFIPFLFLLLMRTSSHNPANLSIVLLIYQAYVTICAVIAVGISVIMAILLIVDTMFLNVETMFLFVAFYLFFGTMLFIFFMRTFRIISSLRHSIELNTDAVYLDENDAKVLTRLTALIPTVGIMPSLLFGLLFGFDLLGGFDWFFFLIVPISILSNIPLVITVRRLYYSY